MKRLFLLAVASLMIVGCAATPPQRASENISQGIYATHDSMEAGRFDLAKKYNDQLTRVVPPPKIRIPIKGIYEN